jgi:hypothetical protein
MSPLHNGRRRIKNDNKKLLPRLWITSPRRRPSGKRDVLFMSRLSAWLACGTRTAKNANTLTYLFFNILFCFSVFCGLACVSCGKTFINLYAYDMLTVILHCVATKAGYTHEPRTTHT